MDARRIGSAARGILCTLMGIVAVAGAGAEEATGSAGSVWDQMVEGGAWGKVSLDARLRMEIADIDPGFRESQAYTLRARLGYETPVFAGFSGFAEGEGVLPFDKSRYYDGIGSNPNRRTLVADPAVLQVNRAFLKYADEETRTAIIAGRQRIKLDDDRFIGNVGWRQNEQTYDSASLATGLGVDGLDLYYGYLWAVRRIFGDKKTGAPGTKDFDVNAHLINASFGASRELDVTLFTYFLDFTTPAAFGFSSNSYGGRITGSHAFSEDWSSAYQVSYALQTDTGKNPVNYTAHYFLGDANVGFTPIGILGVGYELLSSDHGKAVFITPLATLHKFNGWADAFLNNGGPRGLQDLYAYVSPSLPYGLKSRLVVHQFWSDEGGTNLATEYDAVLSKSLNRFLTVLTKGAYFDARRAGPADRWRFWLEATFKF